MISLYQASVPMMIKSLKNLAAIINKCQTHCTTRNISPSEILNSRLIEDMRPLPYQVQSCSNTAKFLATRVGGAPDVVLEDKETTFEELQDRISKTVDILSSLEPNCMDDKDNAEIIMKSAMGDFKFTGYDYVIKYAIPNFHFHLCSAYCIARHLGVPIGAFDYLDSERDLFVKA